MHNRADTNREGKLPYLEYFPEEGSARQQIVITRSPFRIGRSKSADYTIFSTQVSKSHAEILHEGAHVRLRDLGSTNGTFINGHRITDSPLTSGDIVHFARREFRFVHETLEARSLTEVSTTALAKSLLPDHFLRDREHLQDLIQHQLVTALFQPIVQLQTREVLGYEALGRSTHPHLNVGPGELFCLAEQCKLAPEPSRVFRSVSVQQAQHLPARARLFLNLHPSEALDEGLVHSLQTIRAQLRSDQKLVLEVHEEMVTDPSTLCWLRETLNQSGIELAYDDFGAGRARLAELVEIPPDYVKLDMSLVRGLDQATARQDLIHALMHGISDLGVELIAEGIETVAEVRVCRGLRCRFGQGYLLGRPEPVTAFSPSGANTN